MLSRKSLSPDQKLGLIVAFGAALLALETVLIVQTLRNKPAPKPTPQASAQPTGAPQSSPAPNIAPTASVFTVPGSVAPGSVAPGSVAPPASFDAPSGVAPAGSGVAAPSGVGVGAAPASGAVSGATAARSAAPGALAAAPLVAPARGARAETPQIAEARRAFDTGSAALKRGDKGVALKSFRRVVTLAPDNLPSRLNLAVLYLEAKQPQNALPHLRRVTALDPKNAAVRFNLARALLALRRPREAVPVLQEVVRLAPNERDGRVLLAESLGEVKRPREAYAQWTFLANRDKNDIGAHLAAATYANDAFKRPAEAETWLRRAATSVPRDPRAPLLLGQLLLSRKRAREADAVLTKAAKSRPDVFELWPALAQARVASGNPKGAVDALRSALLRLPVATKPDERARLAQVEGGLRLALGRVYGNDKKLKDALREFRTAARLRPRDAESRSLAAVASLQLKDAAGATRLLRESVRLEPRRDGDRRLLARLFAESKKWRESDAQFEIYCKNQPKDAEALLMWAQVAQNLKNRPREVAIVRSLTRAAPKEPFVWTQLGVLLRETGDQKGALEAFSKLATLRPNDAKVHLELARAQTALGAHPGALRSWQTVVRLDPKLTPAYQLLLAAGDSAGQSEATRAWMASEMARHSENVAALTSVLSFYERTKRAPQARVFLTDLVKRNPKHQAAQAALKSFTVAQAPSETPASAVAARTGG